MPTGDLLPRRRGLAAVEPSPIVVDEAVHAGEPVRRELILNGGRELARLGADPDDWVDAATEEELRNAQSTNTADAIRWAYGALIHYCGIQGLRHDPPTAATIRRWIKAHGEMTRLNKNGEVVKRGRGGQPYAPATVAMRVYLVAMVCNRLGWLSPTKDPVVADQLEAYKKKFKKAGFKTFEADPITPQLSVQLARTACDLGTVNGLRNATSFRLQFDTGCRATEMVEGLLGLHVRWITDTRAAVTFIETKGGKERTVFVEGMPTLPDPTDPTGERQIPNPEWDVDPVHLLALYCSARAQFGLGDSDPFFTEVSHAARRRNDFDETGIYAGKILRQPWRYDAYVECWNRAVKKSRIDVGPRGTRFHFPSHANRAGLITASVRAGIPSEITRRRTGHAEGSPVFERYYRGADAVGEDNVGVIVRRRAAAETAKQEAERAVRAAKRGGRRGK